MPTAVGKRWFLQTEVPSSFASQLICQLQLASAGFCKQKCPVRLQVGRPKGVISDGPLELALLAFEMSDHLAFCADDTAADHQGRCYESPGQGSEDRRSCL